MNGYGIIAPNTFGKITGAPEPICEPMDAIAEAVAWATCTSDPHQVHAGLPAGLILGHEVVARLVKVGSMVKDFQGRRHCLRRRGHAGLDLAELPG